MKNGIGILALCLLAAVPTWAASYNAHTDFSGSNPNGAWKYGYAPSGTLGSLDSSFSLMPTYTANCVSGVGGTGDCWYGVSSSVVSPNGSFSSGTVNYVDGYVNLHPGANLDLSLLAFVAPVAANYTFVGEFADRDVAGGSGVQLSAVMGTGTFLLGPTTTTAVFSPVAINFTQALAAGQSVYFAVGANGEYSYDSVGLKLDVTDDLSGVPEPSSFLLTGLGAALVIARRFR